MRNQSCVITIRSPRLLLMPLERSNAATVLGWINNEEIVRNFQFFTGHLTLAEEVNYIDRMSDSPADLLLGLWVNEIDLIGTCGLHEIDFINDTARLGLIIGKKEHWNEGYAKEAVRALLHFAFRTMNLHKVYLNVFVTNKKAIHLYTEVGFKIEGTLRREYRIRGDFVDMHRMAILREEWDGGTDDSTSRD